MNEFRSMMAVCANWHLKIREGFDIILKDVENSFINSNINHLCFKESFMSTQNIEFCGQKGLRVDRVICADVLNFSKHVGKTLNFGFTYRYLGE